MKDRKAPNHDMSCASYETVTLKICGHTAGIPVIITRLNRLNNVAWDLWVTATRWLKINYFP